MGVAACKFNEYFERPCEHGSICACLEVARAAIEAMHNPSDEMLAAGVVELSEDVPNQIKAAQVWWEMIDAALEGK
jgi:hypothetical protein